MNESTMMLTSILNCRPVDLTAERPVLSSKQKAALDRMSARRASGEPLQYIIGSCDFMGIELSVEPCVLIPRPETEILTERVIEIAKMDRDPSRARILDLGTGSGNIAIALARNLPAFAVDAVDIDARALALARKNAAANGLASNITFFQDDFITFLNKAVDGQRPYAVIVSNPPYIPTGHLPFLPADVRREPAIALDGGPDGLKFYRSIIPAAGRCIRPGGHLLFEIGDGQRAGIEDIFARSGNFAQLEFTKDYVGTDRVACARFKLKDR